MRVKITIEADDGRAPAITISASEIRMQEDAQDVVGILDSVRDILSVIAVRKRRHTKERAAQAKRNSRK